MRTATPLTAAEKRHLDQWDRTLDTRGPRGYAIAGIGGFLAGTGLGGWMTASTIAAGGASTLTTSAPFMKPVEAAVGPIATTALFAGTLFAVAMLGLVWRLLRMQRAMQAQYRARFIAAGAEPEAPRGTANRRRA